MISNHVAEYLTNDVTSPSKLLSQCNMFSQKVSNLDRKLRNNKND
jgi:hypothetical protein